MKKTVLTVVLAMVVTASFIVWFSLSPGKMNGREILMLAALILVVGFAVFLAYGRFRNVRRELPAEDEWSKGILRRSAATSYHLSLYLWLAIMMFESKLKLERSSLIGAGIMGMALLFALSWVFHRFIRKTHD